MAPTWDISFIVYVMLQTAVRCHGDKVDLDPALDDGQCEVDSIEDKHYRDLEFDFCDHPGIEHRLRFNIEAASEECFYQYLRKGSQFLMEFKVRLLMTNDRSHCVSLTCIHPIAKKVNTILY